MHARGAWSKSTVWDFLRNPKYTGYQVFNRRASRSRHGAVSEPEKCGCGRPNRHMSR
ncbi:MAG TPA: recombinase family protein [Pseudonocardiaceae bacterium]